MSNGRKIIAGSGQSKVSGCENGEIDAVLDSLFTVGLKCCSEQRLCSSRANCEIRDPDIGFQLQVVITL